MAAAVARLQAINRIAFGTLRQIPCLLVPDFCSHTAIRPMTAPTMMMPGVVAKDFPHLLLLPKRFGGYTMRTMKPS